MKRKLVVVLMICLAMAMVFAGGSSESQENAKKIIFWNHSTSEPDKTIINDIVARYNSHPVNGYIVESVPTQNDKYKEKLIIAMSSGQCPDIYHNWSGGPLFEYADSGFAIPLEDYLDASPIKDILSPAGLAQATKDGHVYAIPIKNISIAGIYYNKDIFAKYGFEEPETLSELEHICEVLKADGYIPFALANRTKWTGSQYFMPLAARIGGLEPFRNAVDGTGSFTDESFVKAGEILQDWVRKGYFPEGINSLSEDDGQAAALFYQEKCVMWGNLFGRAGTIKADSPDFYNNKLGWFPFPAVEGYDVDNKIQIGTVGDSFYSINSGLPEEKVEAIWAFIEEHFTEESINQWVAAGRIPPVDGVFDQVEDPLTKKVVGAALDASDIQLWYDQYLPPTVATAHLDGLQEVFGLTKTPLEAQQMMQDAMEAYNASK